MSNARDLSALGAVAGDLSDIVARGVGGETRHGCLFRHGNGGWLAAMIWPTLATPDAYPRDWYGLATN
jgi:hypothetical protein